MWSTERYPTESLVRCIFCKHDSTGSIEHIIPEALTGVSWLTVREVCEKCNNTMGTAVDSLAKSSGMVFRLAVESGLAPWGKLPVEIEDPLTGEYIPGHYNYRDGTVEEITRINTSTGFKLRVWGRTPEESNAEVESIVQKRERRGQPSRIVGPFLVSGRAKTRRTGGEAEAQALYRFAAKACVEYISKTAGSDVAMMPELDSLRSFVLQGSPPTVGRISLFGSPRWLWLPKQSIFLVFDEKLRSSSETRRIEDWMASNPGLPPPGVPFPPTPFHELRIERREASTRFVLTLFGLVLIEVALPTTLPVFSVLHRFDLLTRRDVADASKDYRKA